MFSFSLYTPQIIQTPLSRFIKSYGIGNKMYSVLMIESVCYFIQNAVPKFRTFQFINFRYTFSRYYQIRWRIFFPFFNFVYCFFHSVFYLMFRKKHIIDLKWTKANSMIRCRTRAVRGNLHLNATLNKTIISFE